MEIVPRFILIWHLHGAFLPFSPPQLMCFLWLLCVVTLWGRSQDFTAARLAKNATRVLLCCLLCDSFHVDVFQYSGKHFIPWAQTRFSLNAAYLMSLWWFTWAGGGGTKEPVMTQGVLQAGREVGLMYSFSSQSDDSLSPLEAAGKDLTMYKIDCLICIWFGVDSIMEKLLSAVRKCWKSALDLLNTY